MAEPKEVSTQAQTNQTQQQQGLRLEQRSEVWKEHFIRYTKTEDGKPKEMARCNHCGKEYAYHGTRNLWKHLKKGCLSSQAQGSAGADVGAQQQPAPPPPPGAPSGSGALSLSMVEVELDQQPSLDQEDEPMQMMVGNQCLDMDMQAAPVYSAVVGVGAAPPPQQQPPLPLPPRPRALSQEPGLEEQAHHGPGLDQEEANRDLARMIALHGHDPSIVEDDYFRSFVCRLNPEFELPTREAIEEMCHDVFEQSRQNIPDPWDNFYNESLTVGKVKSMETGEALYIMRHFIDDEWDLHWLVDNAHVLLPPGTQDYNVSTVLGVPVVSREEAVGRVVHYVDNYLKWHPFMVAGEITGDISHLELKRSIEKRYESVNLKVLSTTYMDHVLHSIARCLLPDSDLAKDIFSNVRDLDSKWTRQDRQELLSKLGLDDPWEYNEHWYWCYCSLMMANYKGPITSKSSIVLGNVWGAIYRAIKRISAPNTPTSALCLRELIKVRDVLQYQLLEASAVHEGMSDDADVTVRKALETVDKAIEGSYLVWSIPLVFDPRYKHRYIESEFKRAFGSEATKNYISELERNIFKLCNNDDIINCSPDEAKAELKCYLKHICTLQTEDFDILNWWKVHGWVEYPAVAEMARAALAMPTCSKLTSDQIAHVRSIIRGYYY